MGTTLEFYSAHTEEFVQLISQEETCEQIKNYPCADFSLHLVLPDDMDTLCRVMRLHGLHVPHSFADLLGEELWSDEEGSAWVKRISGMLAPAWAGIDDVAIEQIAPAWVRSYIPISTTLDCYAGVYHDAYLALSQLRNISQDALQPGRELLLFCVGIEMSWPGWYHEPS